ncbi:hypothetical protein AB4090_12580 [Acidithiobacillus sp. IBUN Pt1247-S3]
MAVQQYRHTIQSTNALHPGTAALSLTRGNVVTWHGRAKVATR